MASLISKLTFQVKLLTISQLNKGTAFSREEQRIFNLRGKLPNRVESLDDQVVRAYLQYKSFDI